MLDDMGDWSPSVSVSQEAVSHRRNQFPDAYFANDVLVFHVVNHPSQLFESKGYMLSLVFN